MSIEKHKKQSLKILAGFCLPVFLCGAGSQNLPPAPQTPPGTTPIVTIAGQWHLQEVKDPSGAQVPEITLETTDYLKAKLDFIPRNYVTAWDAKHAGSFRPRVRARIAFNPKVLQCDGLPLKLWFEDGETLNLGGFTCQGNRLITGTEDTDKQAQNDREQDLAKFLLRHHPVAITQGRASLLLNYSLQKDFQRFQKETNPNLNRQYFKQARGKWHEDIKNASAGLKITIED